MNNKRTIILLIMSIIIVIAATVGITFAYLSVSAVQTSPNTISTSCYNMTFTDSNVIKVTSYPMSEAKGLASTPYSFNITNTCGVASTYQIFLNVKNTTDTDILPFINYSLDGTTSNLLSKATSVNLPNLVTSQNVMTSYLIKTGSLTSSSSFNLRLWIADYAGNNIMGKKFEAEVMIYSVANSSMTAINNVNITNLITDATFENNNWTNASFDTTHVKYGNKALKINGSASSVETLSTTKTTIPLISGHKYYARYEIYHEGATGTVGLYWPIAEPNFFEQKSIGSANTWRVISGVNVRNFSSSNYQLRIDYNNSKATTSMWFDGAVLVDLTATFGSGNEPNVTWCDANIPFFTGTKKINYISTS